MSEPADSDLYDFRKPGHLNEEVEELLSAWLSALRSALADRWSQHLCFELEPSVAPLGVASGSNLNKQYDEESVIYRFDIGEAKHPTAVLLSRQLALALVNGMLGETSDELPEDRPLTDVEQSLIELLIHEFHTALEESQSWEPPVSTSLDGTRRLKDLHKDLPKSQNVVVAQLGLGGPLQGQHVGWILSQAAVISLATHVAKHNSGGKEAAPDLEHNVRRIPVNVVVCLGHAKLHVSDLAHLRAGDVLVLDQRVTDPLTTEVGGEAKFQGWPGRSGLRQALQIDSLVS